MTERVDELCFSNRELNKFRAKKKKRGLGRGLGRVKDKLEKVKKKGGDYSTSKAGSFLSARGHTTRGPSTQVFSKKEREIVLFHGGSGGVIRGEEEGKKKEDLNRGAHNGGRILRLPRRRDDMALIKDCPGGKNDHRLFSQGEMEKG